LKEHDSSLLWDYSLPLEERQFAKKNSSDGFADGPVEPESAGYSSVCPVNPIETGQQLAACECSSKPDVVVAVQHLLVAFRVTEATGLGCLSSVRRGRGSNCLSICSGRIHRQCICRIRRQPCGTRRSTSSVNRALECGWCSLCTGWTGSSG